MVEEKTLENKISLNDDDWSVSFEMGREIGYDEGKEDGLAEGKAAGFQEGQRKTLEDIKISLFNNKFDLLNTIECAESFIDVFKKNFEKYSISAARIGVAPSSSIPTAFFILDVPEDIPEEDDERIDSLKRSIERKFSNERPGHSVCIWSTEKYIADFRTIESDFPIFKKFV